MQHQERDDRRKAKLGELTWPELKEALPSVKLVVIPTGAFEQHGPHMTLNTDTEVACAFAEGLAERFRGKILVAPPIAFGLSAHHMSFPGTVTLQPETFLALGRDIVHSLASHGFKKFLFLNAHGGNRATLSTLCLRLRQELKVEVVSCTWLQLVNDVITQRVGLQRVHACEVEASVGLWLSPQVVRREKLSQGAEKVSQYRHTNPKEPWSVEYPYLWHELTDNGAMGDGRKADEEFGEQLCRTALDRLSLFVDEFIDR